jgi:excinuclease ABC subunit C
LTLGDAFPRLALTHELIPDGSQYLGPFPGVDVAAIVLAALQRLFPLRTCEAVVRPGVFPTPCEAYHLRKCIAPCVGAHLAPAYDQQVKALLALLARGHAAIVQRLGEKRQQAADSLFFERAAHLQIVLAALEEASSVRPLTLLPVALRNFVVIFTQAPPHTYEMFGIRGGLFAGRVVGGGKSNDGPMVEAFLRRCYGVTDEAPPAIEAVVDELRIVAGWLQRTRTRARWVSLEVPLQTAAAVEAVMAALP